MVEPSKEELEKVLKELEKMEAKKKKVFEAYEEEIISKKDFSERIADIKAREEMLHQEANRLKSNTLDDNLQVVSYEFVKSILSSFDKMLSEQTTRYMRKKSAYRLFKKENGPCPNPAQDNNEGELEVQMMMEEVLLLILFQEEL